MATNPLPDNKIPNINIQPRYKSYAIPGETLIPGGRGSVSPWYWICLISNSNPTRWSPGHMGSKVQPISVDEISMAGVK